MNSNNNKHTKKVANKSSGRQFRKHEFRQTRQMTLWTRGPIRGMAKIWKSIWHEGKQGQSERPASVNVTQATCHKASIYPSIHLSISGSSHYSHGPQFMSNCDVWGQLWPASTIMTHTNVSNCQTYDKRTHKSRWGRQGLWAKGQRLWCEPHNIPADNVMKWRPAWILISPQSRNEPKRKQEQKQQHLKREQLFISVLFCFVYFWLSAKKVLLLRPEQNLFF